MKFKIEIANKNVEIGTREYKEDFSMLIDDLNQIGKIEKSKDPIKGNRGVSIDAELILKIFDVGMFASVYLLLKDFYEKYHNCDVKITKENGVEITIKGTTLSKALKLVEDNYEEE